ncbi:NAD(P)-dependent oxidoreductase [Streptosporangium sp. NPDC000396]|uniref:NAD(P)-dependent oxidoreductase n=1 Tax=Streptosporangium sp. NPDC000396 TaxID=3366185 RepID=UPI003694BEAB
MNGETVGFVGLGVMGLPMAVNLARSGLRVLAWNRGPAMLDAAVRNGCAAAATPREVAAGAPTVITMLPGLPEVQAVLDGPAGLLSPDSVLDTLVVMGTVAPDGVRRLGDTLALRGVKLVDAPVSGGEKGAREATLSIMAGGEPAAVSRVWPYLEAMGSTVRHVGPLGAGALAKACNQIVVAGTLAALAEAVLLAESGGLDVAVLLEILDGGLAASEVLTQKREHLLSGDFHGSGSVENLVKGLDFAMDSAVARNVALPVTAAAARLYRAAVTRGLGDLDNSVVLDVLRRLPGFGAPPHEDTPPAG